MIRYALATAAGAVGIVLLVLAGIGGLVVSGRDPFPAAVEVFVDRSGPAPRVKVLTPDGQVVELATVLELLEKTERRGRPIGSPGVGSAAPE